METENDQCNNLLRMTPAQMYVIILCRICFSIKDSSNRRDFAMFVDSYPTLDITHELMKDEYTAGAPVILKVGLVMDADEDDADGDDQIVVAPFYPAKKMANWWLLFGNSTGRQLLVVKRVTVSKEPLCQA
jgi:pre-mRNA-splicing helicase BRR2